jgi:hypothetical protein
MRILVPCSAAERVSGAAIVGIISNHKKCYQIVAIDIAKDMFCILALQSRTINF